ncbi:MAG: CRISPR-associated endonuclease Cas3'', partial [Armatimonadota bacterium]
MTMQTLSFSCPPDYTILWAKSDPRHPLWKHLLDAAAVSLALPCPINDSSWNHTAVALLVGLHDIGKADSRFQHQVSGFSGELTEAGFPKTADAPCRHEYVSAEFVRKELVNDGLDEYVADAIARALVAHHGYWNERPCGVSDIYKKAQDQLYCMLKKILRINSFPSQSPSNLSDFGMRLAGHVVLCDWIASNEEFFTDSRLEGCEDPVRYWTVAQEVAAEWTDKLSLKRVPRQAFACRVVENTRPIQEAVLKNNIPPGLVIIEAPMGEGKTEAAWILAEKWRG